jgi:shikimate dehydrogenase
MAPASSIRLGLIGDNIKRSKSPLLHTLAGRLCGLDVRYDTLIPADLGQSFAAVFERWCRGSPRWPDRRT